LSVTTSPAPAGPTPEVSGRPDRHAQGPLPAAGLFVAAIGVTAALAVVHLTQGTSTVGATDLLALLTGSADADVLAVLLGSRVPRLAAALTIGVALGIAGGVLQSVARNPLASPDTLAVNAGAHLAVVAAAALGISLPVLPTGGLAFTGGLLAAGLVLALSAGGSGSPTRLVLAGSATAMALGSFTMLLLLLFEQETLGLYAWGNGSLTQSDLVGVRQMAPVVVAAIAGVLLMARRLDLLALGDDTAAVLGLHVRRTRLVAVVLAVLLSAAAVTLAGPIGFVGLCAPVAVRLAVRAVPTLQRHRLFLPLAGLAGAALVVASDVALRVLLGGQAGVMVPTGVVTSFVGAGVLMWLARRAAASSPSTTPPGVRHGSLRLASHSRLVVAALILLALGSALLGMLAGDTVVLLGDLANWVRGDTGPAYTFVLDQRLPRVVAALAAGAALGLAGAAVQAVCRNPLAEPGILGITAGAGLGAVILLTVAPFAGVWAMTGVAGVGALVAFALVYGLAWRGGLDSERLVLIGIGVSAGLAALITLVIVATDPWNTGKALTWLSGSTYGRTLDQVVPVVVALGVLGPLLLHSRHQLDLLALDEDSPRVLGLALGPSRLAMLGAAAALTATAVSAVGVVGFVGLVAPHVARALVGGRHRRVLPVATLLGALLVSLADTLGRTVIAPAQIPAGLVTAMIGTPYFVYLLWRTRAGR
jgi:ferric hydroxamate transport system permease protein